MVFLLLFFQTENLRGVWWEVEVEREERKWSSDWANLRRVRLHDSVMLVREGNLCMVSMALEHLFIADSTCSIINHQIQTTANHHSYVCSSYPPKSNWFL